VDAEALVVAKKERAVLPDRPADGDPELIQLELRFARVKVLTSIQGAVAQKLEGGSVQFVRSRAGDDVDDCASGRKLRVVVSRLNLEFLNGFESITAVTSK